MDLVEVVPIILELKTLIMNAVKTNVLQIKFYKLMEHAILVKMEWCQIIYIETVLVIVVVMNHQLYLKKELVKNAQTTREHKMEIRYVVETCVHKISSTCLMVPAELVEKDLSQLRIGWTVLKLLHAMISKSWIYKVIVKHAQITRELRLIQQFVDLSHVMRTKFFWLMEHVEIVKMELIQMVLKDNVILYYAMIDKLY